MEWARRRQIVIVSGILSFILLFIALVTFFAVQETPTCFDGVQNGTELGVDCGGECELLCSFEVRPIAVLFAQYVVSGGRPDVIAHLQNTNIHADATRVEYIVEVFTREGDLFAQERGTLTIPHGQTRGLFIPRIATASPQNARAFVRIEDSVFEKAQDGPRLSTGSFTWSSLDNTPQLEVTIRGDEQVSLRRVPLVVTVFDENNTILAASQTIVDSIARNGSTQAFFSWNEPFDRAPARIEFLFDTPRSYGNN